MALLNFAKVFRNNSFSRNFMDRVKVASPLRASDSACERSHSVTQHFRLGYILETGRSIHTCSRLSEYKATAKKDIFSHSSIDFLIKVKTGDQLHAGTDANVHVILHSESGQRSDPIQLDYAFRDDFERGQLDEFQLKGLEDFKDVHKIEIWRDGSGVAADWFVDYIEIESVRLRTRFMFPMFRWIKADRRYVIRHMDNCLPQDDPEPFYRKQELDQKKIDYQCASKFPRGPAQVNLILSL